MRTADLRELVAKTTIRLNGHQRPEAVRAEETLRDMAVELAREVIRLRILTEKMQPASESATNAGNCNQRNEA